MFYFKWGRVEEGQKSFVMPTVREGWLPIMLILDLQVKSVVTVRQGISVWVSEQSAFMKNSRELI